MDYSVTYHLRNPKPLSEPSDEWDIDNAVWEIGVHTIYSHTYLHV